MFWIRGFGHPGEVVPHSMNNSEHRLSEQTISPGTWDFPCATTFYRPTYLAQKPASNSSRARKRRKLSIVESDAPLEQVDGRPKYAAVQHLHPIPSTRPSAFILHDEPPPAPIMYTIPLPPLTEGYDELNALPFLHWDVLDPPNDAKLVNSPCQGTASHWSSYMFSRSGEPLRRVFVILSHDLPALSFGLLPPIDVYRIDGRPVHVIHVLESIHRYFRTPLTLQEIQTLPRHLKDDLEGTRAHRLRRRWENSQPYLRIDVMNGWTRFAGLSPTGSQNESEFVLKLER